MTTPLLIISDAPTAGTGLARITRDLATRIHANLSDVFRVATLGYGGSFSRALPFIQYEQDMQDWMIFNLPEVWEDFAGAEKGIVMTIWDASRLLWFSRPENCANERLKKFLTAAPFKRWGYFPIDATGPHDKLTAILAHTISGYDRVLAYSKWAEDILRRTCPTLDGLTNLPHGIDTSVFRPRERHAARHGFGERIGARTQKGKFLAIPDDAFMIGIVATNQVRKDWGLGIQVVAAIKEQRPVFLWCHIDELERHWSLPALLNDFGLLKETVVTTVPLTDEQMSWCYSACDVTLGVGLGEGWGFPIFESIFCGTPCVHGDYGGAAEHLSEDEKVPPEMYRIEGPYNCVRPVFYPREWGRFALAMHGRRMNYPGEIEWGQVWPRWAEWLTKGLK